MAHSGSVHGDMAVFDNMRAVGKGVRRGGRLQRRTRHNHLPNEVADLGKQRGRPGGSTGLASDCQRSAQERRVRRWLQRTHSGTANCGRHEQMRHAALTHGDGVLTGTASNNKENGRPAPLHAAKRLLGDVAQAVQSVCGMWRHSS
jgi:hypothetical protein